MESTQHAKVLAQRAADEITTLVHQKATPPGHPSYINTAEYTQIILNHTGVALLINQLQTCIDLLCQVRSSEDLERKCHGAARNAQALLDAQIDCILSTKAWRCSVCRTIHDYPTTNRTLKYCCGSCNKITPHEPIE